MGAQLRYATSVRRHSSAVLHGRRHTPSRHWLPAAHWLLSVQKGRRRPSVWQTPWSVQYSPEAHSVGPLHRWKQLPFKQRRPAPQAASLAHASLGPSTQTLFWHTWPAGQLAPAPQAVRQVALMQTRPVPHWLLKRHSSDWAAQLPARHTRPVPHWLSAVQGQLWVRGLQVER